MNSKNKGNTFERKVANLLSKRFETKTGIKKSFRRNADSGSFFGGINQNRIETHNTETAAFGDLICPKTFVYCLECKHYKTAPSMLNIMQEKCTGWDKWLVQAEQDSSNANKKMALIIKYNNVDEIVILKEPITGIRHILYKQYFVMFLSPFLDQSDDHFFENDTQVVGV
jgi:hypothetical protein